LRVLEVGCGAGWVLQNLRTIQPGIHVQGVEPSVSASRAANQAGIDVIQAAAEDPRLEEMHGRFDFIYSIDVIEHTADPVGFVRAMAKFASPNGTVCVICPSGDVVNLELIFLDHLYSIREANLRHIFTLAGLKPLDRGGEPPNMKAWQRLTGKLSDNVAPADAYGCPAALLDMRDNLFHQWRMIDRRLALRLQGQGEVLCFGAGETSDLLRTLAPSTWEKIAGHVVDSIEEAQRKETYRDKPLYYLDDPRLERFDAVLLGVKPHYQDMLYPRLSEKFATVVRWDDLVDDRVEVPL
jgi:SAM-dependent methyltransferase